MAQDVSILVTVVPRREIFGSVGSLRSASEYDGQRALITSVSIFAESRKRSTNALNRLQLSRCRGKSERWAPKFSTGEHESNVKAAAGTPSALASSHTNG